MSDTQTITNQDLMDVMQDMMQLIGEGFSRLEVRMDNLEIRMDRLEARMDSIEIRMTRLEKRVDAIEKLQHEHSSQIGELLLIVHDLQDKHKAYLHDIADVLDRIQVLEERKPEINRAEFDELQRLVHSVIDWARKTVRKNEPTAPSTAPAAASTKADS